MLQIDYVTCQSEPIGTKWVGALRDEEGGRVVRTEGLGVLCESGADVRCVDISLVAALVTTLVQPRVTVSSAASILGRRTSRLPHDPVLFGRPHAHPTGKV